MIKAIIFDMDGVLIDAKEWHYEALNQALSLFGCEIEYSEHVSTYDGLSTSQKLDILSTKRGLPKGLHKFVNELKQVYTMEMIYARCRPMFHHEYALSQLKLEGYQIAVASNSVKESVSVMMERSGLVKYLEFHLSNQDVSKGKPDPEIYKLAISKLGLKPHECMVVEDNENGVKAAKAAKANVMIVETVYDVNYENIRKHLEQFNGVSD